MVRLKCGREIFFIIKSESGAFLLRQFAVGTKIGEDDAVRLTFVPWETNFPTFC